MGKKEKSKTYEYISNSIIFLFYVILVYFILSIWFSESISMYFSVILVGLVVYCNMAGNNDIINNIFLKLVIDMVGMVSITLLVFFVLKMWFSFRISFITVTVFSIIMLLNNFKKYVKNSKEKELFVVKEIER